MSQKFLSDVTLSTVSAGSMLKVDSNGKIVAAVDGTDYISTSAASYWTSPNSGTVYTNNKVGIGYSNAGAKLHVYEYQTTTPKILIEDGNTGDASIQFKVSAQQYTVGIDNSDSDKFVIAASSALGTTNALEIATDGLSAFQKSVLFNDSVYLATVGATTTNTSALFLGAQGIVEKRTLGSAAFSAATDFLGATAKAADSDKLDGIDSSSFLRSDDTDTASGAISFTSSGLSLSGHYYQGFYSGTNNYIHLYPQSHTGAASTTYMRAWTGTSFRALKITGNSNDITWGSHKLWTSGNDGSGSGLDADTLDGSHASDFAAATHTHTLSEITDAGTAAAADTTDFATAAQGALADTALQSLPSHNHDTRYYTKQQSDNQYATNGNNLIPINATDSNYQLFTEEVVLASVNEYRGLAFQNGGKNFVFEVSIKGTNGANHQGIFWGLDTLATIYNNGEAGYKLTHQGEGQFHIRDIATNTTQITSQDVLYAPNDGQYHRYKIINYTDATSGRTVFKVYVDGNLIFNDNSGAFNTPPQQPTYFGFINYTGDVTFSNWNIREITGEQDIILLVGDEVFQPVGNYLTELPAHHHDARYYTETEMDTFLGGKLSTSGGTVTGMTIFEDGLRIGTGNHYTDGRASITFGEGATTSDSMYIEYDGENLGGDNNAIIFGSAKDGVGDVFRVTYGGSVLIGSNAVATQSWVQSQNYLTSLPAHNHDSDYINVGGDTMTGILKLNAGVTNNNWSTFTHLEGAYNVNNPSGTTGAIRIELPTAEWGTNTMMSMTVKVYEYSTGKSFTLFLGGYNYYTHNWYNTFASMVGDNERGDIPVKFGNDGSRDVIWIGNPDWSWSYPNVWVTDFQSGHTQGQDWNDGWRIVFDESDATNVTSTQTAHKQITTNNISSQSVSYATSAGSATSSTTSSTANKIVSTAASGSVLMKHNNSEANAWIFQEAAANWGVYWFNTGSQSGQSIGNRYTTVGAEMFGFRHGNSQSGIQAPQGWSGVDSNTYYQWMISNYTGSAYFNNDVESRTGFYVNGNAVATQAWVSSQGYITSETDSQTLTFNSSNGELTISNGNTVDLDSRYLDATSRKTWFGINASGTQAKRYRIGRVYYCPAHWDDTWQNIKFKLTEETYSGAFVEYSLFGYYNGSQNQTLDLRVTDFRGLPSDTRRYSLELGQHRDAGWEHSGQPVYYTDIFVDVSYYKGLKVMADTLGHSWQSTDPTSGAAITVFYSTPEVADITYTNVDKTTTYLGLDYKIWNSANDGSGSGLDADLLDGMNPSTSATANTIMRRDSNGDTSLRILNVTNEIRVPSGGGVTDPTITCTTDGDTGLNFSGSGDMSFTSNGTKQFDFSQITTAIGWGNHASAGYLTSVPSTFSATQITLGSGVVLRESSDRADLLSISSSTSSWGGLQVTNSSNEALGSFMVNDSSIGLYDDQQGEWIMLYTENAGIQFFNNGNAKLTTNGSGANVVGRLYATDGIQVDYSTGGHEPMIVLNGATNYGLFHTEATSDFFTFDFNGEQRFKFGQNGSLSFGTAGNGTNTGGAFASIEGNADTSGEGSGRLFFREHNSTTAAMDNYGMSFGYRGGSTAVTTAGGNTWNGLSQIGNGAWGMWGHDNNADGALIMYGDRQATYVNFAGNNVQGVNDLYVADQIIHTGDTNTYMQFHAADQWRVVTGGAERLEVQNGSVNVQNDFKVAGSYTELGNAIGSVSNDGGWNARLNVAGSSHARLDVKSVSDGIITTMYAHTGNNMGKVGTMSNHALGLMTAGSEKVILDAGGNMLPVTDRTQWLGLDTNRWQIVFCEILDSAGQHEKNLQNPEGEKSVGEYETGTVLVWKGGKNVPCTTAADHMRMGIAVKGIDSPLIQGAEPVLVTGAVKEGDYLVTSGKKEGHAEAISPAYMRQHNLFDCVLGKALESAEGESHLVKTWINI